LHLIRFRTHGHDHRAGKAREDSGNQRIRLDLVDQAIERVVGCHAGA
jgi:hypothetical protein